MAAVGADAATEADEPKVAPLRRSVPLADYGLKCFAYGMMANGHWTSHRGELGIDDIAALEPVVRNAGGVLTVSKGGPVDARYAGRILAAGDPRLHRAALALMDATAPG